MFKITAEERDYLLKRRAKNGGKGLGPNGVCVCTKCGYEEQHGINDPCDTKLCPKCGTQMDRK